MLTLRPGMPGRPGVPGRPGSPRAQQKVAAFQCHVDLSPQHMADIPCDIYSCCLAFSQGQGLSGSALVDQGPFGEDLTYVCAQ